MRILVVDDEPVVVQTLCRLIEEVGHDAFGVTDGPTAIDHFRRARYDVVVVDLVMPQMNGLEVLRRLHATNRETRLVALTGRMGSTSTTCCARPVSRSCGNRSSRRPMSAR